MKKSFAFREITVAVGVLVAVVIALTLWIRVPEKQVSESAQHTPPSLSSAFSKNLIKNIIKTVHPVAALEIE